ncbi:MAG: transporter substrate-binding domain-containing protein [Pseudodesulfovibrio sp.]
MFLHALPARAADLVVLTEENPPYSYIERGEVAGFATDIFLEIAKIANVPVSRDDIQILPWARAYRQAQDRNNIVIYPLARTLERESRFQWVGPLYESRIIIIARKDKRVHIENLRRDVVKGQLGTVRGSASEELLIKNGVPPNDLQRLHDMDLNIRKLKEGRISAIAFGEPSLNYAIKKSGLNPKQLEIVHVLATLQTYYGLSKKIDPVIVQKLQDAFDQAKASGLIDVIIKKYMD